MDKHIKAVVEYVTDRGKATLLAYAPTLEPIIVHYLSHSIMGRESGETQLFLESLEKSQKEAKVVYIADEAWTHLDIGPEVISMYDKVPASPNIKIIKVGTEDMKKVILAWADIYDSFKLAVNKGELWHGIPLNKNNPRESDAMFWDPQTNRTGRWEDIDKDNLSTTAKGYK
jgi:hypothetical protein